jgi:hypothetical protein
VSAFPSQSRRKIDTLDPLDDSFSSGYGDAFIKPVRVLSSPGTTSHWMFASRCAAEVLVLSWLLNELLG